MRRRRTLEKYLPAKKKKQDILNHRVDGSCWIEVVVVMVSRWRGSGKIKWISFFKLKVYQSYSEWAVDAMLLYPIFVRLLLFIQFFFLLFFPFLLVVYDDVDDSNGACEGADNNNPIWLFHVILVNPWNLSTNTRINTKNNKKNITNMMRKH